MMVTAAYKVTGNNFRFLKITKCSDKIVVICQEIYTCRLICRMENSYYLMVQFRLSFRN